MKTGLRVALVSDAGTPTISDPGFRFIREAQDNGIAVEPLPGPCSVTVALSAAGFPTESYHFGGYLPKTTSERLNNLLSVRNLGQTCVFFESPNRVIKTLASMEEVYGERHRVFVAFELTKRFETHYVGTIKSVIEELLEKTEGSRLKGEVTMVLAPGSSEELEIQKIAKGTGFDPQRDSLQKVNAIEIAKKLDNTIEMSDDDFRDLLKGIFPEMPSYHIDALIKITKKPQRKPNKIERLSKLVGGIM